MESRSAQFFEFPTPYSHFRVKEILVFTVLEKTLCNDGIYHQTTAEIEKRYGCSLFDCCKNPHYLVAVLKGMYPKSYKSTIETISRQLDMFSDDEPVASFLKTINSGLEQNYIKNV